MYPCLCLCNFSFDFQGRLTIEWNNFVQSATNIFRQLWISQNFTDFTLARADECQMKAHKVILSPYSDFSKHILLNIFHKSHLVYLNGIKHNTFMMVMQFIYFGQCEAGLNEVLGIIHG